MKIGVLTLSASDNCGSLLQCFALKRVLDQYGEVEVINFTSKASHEMYDVFPDNLKIIQKLKRYVYKKKLLNSRKGYIQFREDYLKIKSKELFPEDLGEVSEKYDVVVVGSDQVWNVKMRDYDDSFFLGWTDSKKIAYGPSMGGKSINESQKVNYLIECLKNFEGISVREEDGKRDLQKYLNQDVIKVLDPTLLLDLCEWDNLVDAPLIEGDYIFYYSWAYREVSTAQIVYEESKRLGIPVYVIDARKWIDNKNKKWKFIQFKESGPTTFLNLMKYSKKCFVESFHGMVFAYIYKKNFWILDTHKYIGDLDSRMMEFVNLLNVSDRILTPYNCLSKDMDEELVFNENKVLEEMRVISRDFINHSIRG